jgi:hypothetical protein
MKRALLILGILFAAAPAAHAAVGYQTGCIVAAGTTCTLPTTAVGQLIVGACYRSGSNTPCSVPAGWTVVINSTGANTNSLAVGCKVATSTSETMGTWTNASDVGADIWTGTAAQDTLHCKQVGMGVFLENGSTGNSMTYLGLTLARQNNTSWVGAFGGHRTASNLTAPSGMTLQQSAGSGPMTAISNTNGTVSSTANQATGVNASSGWRTFTYEVVAACPAGQMCADDYVDMNTGTVGDALTTTNMNAGTVTASTDRTWVMDPSAPPAGLTIGAHQRNRLVPATVGIAQTSFATGSSSKSISYANAGNLTSVDFQIKSPLPAQVTVSGWLVMGPTCVSLVDNLFDLVRVDGIIGNITAVLQMNNLVGAACILNIESVISGSPNHSTGITVTGAGQTVWYTMNVDMIASTTNTCWVSGAAVGCAQLKLYDTSGAQIGSTVKIKLGAGDTVAQIRYGNSESGTASTTTFFEQSLVDYTYNVFPLGPGTAASTTTPKLALLGVGEEDEINWRERL